MWAFMRHLSFYFAVAFAVVGFVMLCTCLSTLFRLISQGYDSFAIVALAMAMLLPFIISILSWKDWQRIQRNQDIGKENLSTKVPELWVGRPWVLPELVVRSILIIAVGVSIVWLEFSFDVAHKAILNVQVMLWTGLVIFLVWVISLMRPLLLRASNGYTLRNDGLEVKAGVLGSKSFVISPSGFSDLEVTRSFSARILNTGDITVRTQGERDIKMKKVRNSLKVADRIREVMARPIFRMEGQELIREHSRSQPEPT